MGLRCPNCGSTRTKRTRIQGQRQILYCKSCKKYPSIPVEKEYKKENLNECELGYITPERITSLDQLIEFCKIDTTVWEIDHWICNKWEVGRAKKKVRWEAVDGLASGTVKDDGEVNVEPLFQIKVWLKRKVKEIESRAAIEELMRDAAEHAPAYPAIKRATIPGGLLYEIGMPDIHFGRLTWSEESGENYDIKIAHRTAIGALTTLLNYLKPFKVSKILFPLGNDFFNVNSKTNATAHDTPQQEDTRWQKTFRAGRVLATEMIDMCAGIADVDVIVVPGNHDVERMFYLGDALGCWYHNSKNVTIDNRAAARKYYQFHKIMLGFTHGSNEKVERLGMLMATEQPQLWGQTSIHEWHIGHIHHKKDFNTSVNEEVGVTVRTLRSLAPADAWTFEKGLVGCPRNAEAFLWDPQKGLLAQFQALA